MMNILLATVSAVMQAGLLGTLSMMASILMTTSTIIQHPISVQHLAVLLLWMDDEARQHRD
jgi:hypothetical protein